jgi:hypothetical protein
MRPPRLIPTPSLKSASNMTIISNYSPHRPEVLVITNGRTQLKGRGASTARPFVTYVRGAAISLQRRGHPSCVRFTSHLSCSQTS